MSQNKYVGQKNWRGQAHGYGVMTSNGNKYDGEWKNGIREGHGVETFASGNKYDGEWKNDIREGHGVYTRADGAKYDGEWKNDEKEGQGIYTAINGRLFSGNWVQDKLNGKSLDDLDKKAKRFGSPRPPSSSSSSSSSSCSSQETLQLLSKVEVLSLNSSLSNGERLRLMGHQTDLAELIDNELARLIKVGIENEKKHNADCNNKGKQHQRNLQAVKERHARELLEIKKEHEQEMANLHHANTTSKNQNQRRQQMLTEKKDIIQTNINTLENQNLAKPFAQTLVPSTANPQMPEPPNEFLCPINQEVMIDPVSDNEGISYERKAIEDWLRLGNLRSPITNKPLRSKDLRPNVGLRNLIQDWAQK